MRKNTVSVFGGAGFIGSAIARAYLHNGWDVTVVDGLMKKTGGSIGNIKDILPKIEFIQSNIENTPGLANLLDKSTVIVDCMAWTSHRLSLKEPSYDMLLNLSSHLCLIGNLRRDYRGKIIYLGSRSQYGAPYVNELTEDTPMVPLDVQGIHKLAAESHYRVYSKLNKLNVISLRFPNCFGENQPTNGDDIGLVGDLIRSALTGKEINVFGSGRRKNLVYAMDVADVVLKLSGKEYSGFVPLNMGGVEITIEELVNMIIDIVGKGTYKLCEMPDEIRAIDVNCVRINSERLRNLVDVQTSDIKKALEATVKYFKEKLA